MVILSGRLVAQSSDENDFSLSIGTKYMSRFVAYGIDLADESPAWGLNMSLAHTSGFYIDGYYTNPTNTSLDARQMTLDLGYEYEFSDVFTFYAEYSRYFYSSDTVNVFAQFSNSISFNADFDLSVVDIGLSYDRFLSSEGASYFSFDISSFQEAGPLYLLPMIQIVFMSHTVDERYLDKGKSKKPNGGGAVITTTVTGLANTTLSLVAVYPVINHLYLTIVPSFIFYHQDDISIESTRFIWNAGLRYTIHF
jgi:hypothetical protein